MGNTLVETNEVKVNNAEIKQAESKLKVVNEAIERRSNVLADMKKELDALNDSKNEVNVRIANEWKEINRAKDDIAVKEKNLAIAIEYINDKKKSIEARMSEVAMLENKLKQDIAKMRSSCNAIEDAEKKMEQALALEERVKKDNERFSAELRAKTEELNAQKKELAVFDSKCKELDIKIDAHSKAINDYKTAIARLNVREQLVNEQVAKCEIDRVSNLQEAQRLNERENELNKREVQLYDKI